MVTAYTIPPAGVTAASFFVPATIVDPANPPVLLADNIGPDGDFVSIFTAPHPVDAAIREAFRLKRLSGAALADAGQQFEEIDFNDEQAPRRLEDEAKRIMQPFVDRGHVRIDRDGIEVDTEAAVDLGAVRVTYTNLQTRNKRTVAA